MKAEEARRTRRTLTPSARAGSALVAAVVAFAALGPLVSRHDPYASDFVSGIAVGGGPRPPCRQFLLGTDRLFRDELARLAVGGRLSLTIATAATALSSAIGGAVGVVAGWFEGTAVDGALFAIVDVGASFPFLLLVMALGAAVESTTPTSLFLILGLTGWLGTARLVRARTREVRSLDFVLAARALGQRTSLVILRHVVPNVAGTVVVAATLSVAQMILAESALGYLGVSLPPPAPTWGRMLQEGQDVLTGAPWLVALPGGLIVVSALGWNLLGEGLRDGLGSANR